MGKDIKKRFTVSLDIETKDLEKQVKSTVGNLKTILADLGNASDKMGYFKELVDYISQVDKALFALKTKNGDVFDTLFDGLDADLRKVMESIFDTSHKSMSVLDELRNKVNNAAKSGAGVQELRSMATEINSLFAGLGRAEPIDIDAQFAGRGKTEDRIKILTDALDNFATVWDNVNNKVKNGFGFEGTVSGGGDTGIEQLSDEVQAQIDKLNKQISELEDIKTKLRKISKDIGIAASKGNAAIPEVYKTELTIESIQKLMDEFDLLSAKMESSDKSSADYYNNLLRLSEISLTLKKAMSDIRADESIKNLFIETPGGYGHSGNMLGKLSAYAVQKSSGILDQTINLNKDKLLDGTIKSYLSQIESLKTGNKNIQTSNEKIGISYQELKQKIKEYYDLVDQYNDESLDDDAIDDLADRMEKLSQQIATLGKGKQQVEDIRYVLAQLDSLDIDFDDAFASISKILGVTDMSPAIEAAKVKLQAFFDTAKKFRSMESLDGIDFDSTVNELRSARDELEKLAKQGVITEQQMTDVSTAFRTAQTKLNSLRGNYKDTNTGAGHGIGTGDGSGSGEPITNIDFTSLENTIKSEISSLSGKLDNVFKVEIIKNDTENIQSAIDGIRTTIDKISANIDTYNMQKNTSAEQAEVNVMKNNLIQLLKYVSDFNGRKVDGEYQQQELGAAIMSDGSVTIGYGEDGTVPWDRMASSLVANLSKSLMVDVHSHPWETFPGGDRYANDFFSGSKGDIGAFKTSKELGAQLAAMITGNVMRTLDISKLTDAQMRQLRNELAYIEKTDSKLSGNAPYMKYHDDTGKLNYYRQSTLSEQHNVTDAFENLMYKAFNNIGFSKEQVDQDIFKKYDLTNDQQLTELAERLVQLSHSAQNSLTPVERLSEIVSQFGADMSTSRAKDKLLAYEKGEISAADVFNALNTEDRVIDQDTINSLMRIDTANEISSVESLLTQITNVLDVISTNVSNINNNTMKSTGDKFDSTINDIIDIRNGKISDNLTKGIQSIFDPLNVSEYKNAEVLSLASASVMDYQDSLDDLFRQGVTGNIGIVEIENVLNKFATAMSHVQDAIKQIDMYENRTDELVFNGSARATESLGDQFDDVIDFDNLQKLLYLLSQAKIDIGKTKDFYKGGLTTSSSDNMDYSGIDGSLQSIKSTLDSIYGVLQGFTGIQADNKNSIKYKEPVIDSNPIEREFTDQDLSVLNSILNVIQDIGTYISTHQSKDLVEDQDNNDIAELSNFIKSKLAQQLATEDVVQAIKTVVDNLYSVLSQKGNEAKQEDDVSDEQQESDVYKLLVGKLPKNVASEDMLTAIKGVLDQIADLVKTEKNDVENKDEDLQEGLGTLVSALTASVNTLKDATNGIVQYQKAQKSNTSAAMARIADPKQHQQISDIALNSVSNLGSQFEIKSLQALSDGLVKVEGAFKNVNGEWEGFTVKVNNANNAVDLAVNKQSAFAKSCAATEKALEDSANSVDENKKRLTSLQTYEKALGWLDTYKAEGKKTTLQYKDNGRFTVSAEETIGGITRTTFRTFDQDMEDMERTTVTVSDSIAQSIIKMDKTIEDSAKNLTNNDIYKKYLEERDKLFKMNDQYQRNADLDQGQIDEWNKQISLVQQMGNEVSGLIKKQEKLNSQKGLAISNAKLKGYKKTANDLLKNTGIDLNSSDLEQQKIVDAYENVIEKIAILKNSHEALTDEQINDVNVLISALKQEADAYVQLHGIAKEEKNVKRPKTQTHNKTPEQRADESINLRSLREYKKVLNNVTQEKSLRFNIADEGLSGAPKEIADGYRDAIKQIEEYIQIVKDGGKIELSVIQASVDALQQKISEYKIQNNIVDGRRTPKNSYGTTATINARAKFNTLKRRSQSYLDDGSIVVGDAFTKYETSLNNLIALQTTFKREQELSPEQLMQFTQLKNECNEYGKALKKILDSSDKLHANASDVMFIGDDIALDTYNDRAKALQNYVRETYGASAATGRLNGDATQLAFVIKNGDGTITNMTASLNAARTAIASTTGATQKSTTAFGRFFDELKDKARGITTYLISMTGFQEVWQFIRQGITYVREIDSALTELKKVTDETDATYDNFLQNMSKTAGVVGSTVSELTTMAAEWARLNI